MLMTLRKATAALRDSSPGEGHPAMKMYSRGQLMAGAAAVPLHIALETKDANVGDPSSRPRSTCSASTITDFRKKNDEDLAQIRKGQADAVTKDELDKDQKAIDDAIAAVKKRADEIEAKANRSGSSAAATSAALEIKHAAAFGKLVGKKDFTPDQLAEYKAALEDVLRNPERKAQTLMVGSDPAGGYLVTPDKTGRIVKKVYETTPMRQLANVVSIGTDQLEGMIDNGEADALWAGEQTTRVQTDTPQIGQWKIEVFELYAYPKVTQKLLEDATIDVEAWLSDKVGLKFARKENTAFITGNGILKPRGLLDYTGRHQRRRHPGLGHLPEGEDRHQRRLRRGLQRHRQAAGPDLRDQGGLPPERPVPDGAAHQRRRPQAEGRPGQLRLWRGPACGAPWWRRSSASR
jgi:hypothetical protein